MPRKRARSRAKVVDLGEVRRRLRLISYQEKISRVLEANRQAFGRLYGSGALFSREGTRAGRDLLLVHALLLRMVSLVNQLSDSGDVPPPRTVKGAEAVYRELDALLLRTADLATRTGHMLSRLSE